MVGLGDLPGGDFYSDAWDVSADGSTIVGASSPTPAGSLPLDQRRRHGALWDVLLATASTPPPMGGRSSTGPRRQRRRQHDRRHGIRNGNAKPSSPSSPSRRVSSLIGLASPASRWRARVNTASGETRLAYLDQ